MVVFLFHNRLLIVKYCYYIYSIYIYDKYVFCLSCNVFCLSCMEFAKQIDLFLQHTIKLQCVPYFTKLRCATSANWNMAQIICHQRQKQYAIQMQANVVSKHNQKQLLLFFNYKNITQCLRWSQKVCSAIKSQRFFAPFFWLFVSKKFEKFQKNIKKCFTKKLFYIILCVYGKQRHIKNLQNKLQYIQCQSSQCDWFSKNLQYGNGLIDGKYHRKKWYGLLWYYRVLPDSLI